MLRQGRARPAQRPAARSPHTHIRHSRRGVGHAAPRPSAPSAAPCSPMPCTPPPPLKTSPSCGSRCVLRVLGGGSRSAACGAVMHPFQVLRSKHPRAKARGCRAGRRMWPKQAGNNIYIYTYIYDIYIYIYILQYIYTTVHQESASGHA